MAGLGKKNVRKRSLRLVNEHLEHFFNTALASKLALNFNHLEIVLTYPTIWAQPIFRHIVPTGTRL